MSVAGPDSTSSGTDKYSALSPHSGLEVAGDTGPEHVPHNSSYGYNQAPGRPYGYQPPDQEKLSSDPTPTAHRNPFGLSALAFGALVALITAIIVGAAVGGGVGGSLSKQKCSSSGTSPTSTASTSSRVPATVVSSSLPTGTTASTALPSPSSLTNYLAPEAYYVSTLSPPSCSSSNSRLATWTGEDFNLFCGVDMSSGDPDVNDPTLVVADFAGLFAYSMLDCLYACSAASAFANTWNYTNADSTSLRTCQGVTWNYAMAQSNSSNHANCWLKNGTVATGYQCNTCVSGKLIT